MRASTYVAALLPIAVSAAPASVGLEDRGLLGNIVCLTNKLIINKLLANQVAINYCADVADVASVTVTSMVTQTAAAITVTVPVTASGSAPVTITNTLTETKTVTPLLAAAVAPSSTVTLSCLNSAYKATANVGKRALSTVTLPKPTELAAIADALIPNLCSCMALPTQTVTVLSTKLLNAATVTVAVTVNPSAKATSTALTTVTVTQTAGTGTLNSAAAGVAGAALSVATALAPNGLGLSYKKFTHNFSPVPKSLFSASAFKSMTPDFSGVYPSLNFNTPYWPATSVAALLTLDRAESWDSSQAALLFQGFFVAPTTGTYTFSTTGDNIDNWGYLWTGDAALNWTDDNAAYKATRLVDSATVSGSTSVTMNAGDALPITWLWANGGTAGQSQVAISGPSGAITDLAKSLLPLC